jgi:leader peptidase (prepilin peptidase)/N-methyltransferase
VRRRARGQRARALSAAAEIAAAARRSPVTLAAAVVVAAALVAGTLVHDGVNANGIAWSVVQVVLVFVAWFDVLERRILNVVVLPAAVLVVALRIAFEREELVETILAGLIAFVVFLVLAVLVKSGLGMGDVKLAGLIGLLLGTGATYALILGVMVGGVAAVLLLATRRATRTSTYAYGPYLALGAAVWIVAAHPPPLV